MLVPLILHCTSGQGSEATSTTTVTLGVPESTTMTVPSIRSLAAMGLVAVRSVTTGDTERNKIMTDDYMQSLMTTAHTHATAQSCIQRGINNTWLLAASPPLTLTSAYLLGSLTSSTHCLLSSLTTPSIVLLTTHWYTPELLT